MTVESGLDGLARKGCFWTDVSELVCGKTAHKPVLSIIISVNYSWPLLLPFFFLMPHLLIGSFFIWFTLPLLETRSPHLHSLVLPICASKSSLTCVLSKVGTLKRDTIYKLWDG